MLTALQKLEVRFVHGWLNFDLSCETFALELPQLVTLEMVAIEHGQIILSCPKLADICFWHFKSMRIKVKAAALARLTLASCKMINFTLTLPKDQLRLCNFLSVKESSEVGTHLIESVSHMTQLQNLEYEGFPAACMPKSFPQQILDMSLSLWDKFPNDPGAHCHPRVDWFHSVWQGEAWDATIARPLAELPWTALTICN